MIPTAGYKFNFIKLAPLLRCIVQPHLSVLSRVGVNGAYTYVCRGGGLQGRNDYWHISPSVVYRKPS